MRIQTLARNMEGDLGTLLITRPEFNVEFRFSGHSDTAEAILTTSRGSWDGTIIAEEFPAFLLWLQKTRRMDSTLFKAKIQEINEPYMVQYKLVLTTTVAS